MISDSKCNNISRRCTWASSCATTETSVCRFGETNKFAGIRMDGHVRPQVNGPHSEVADGVENIFALYRLMLRSRSFGRTDSRVSGSTKDRKSTRLNSSHVSTSYAVFCLKKK